MFDNFDEFLNLLRSLLDYFSSYTSHCLLLTELVARILGLLSLVLAKAHILDMARKLAQRHLGTKSDGKESSSRRRSHWLS